MSPQIACMNPCWLHLIFLRYVFSNVSSLWEYFYLQGPWQKVLTDLKKSLYTLQADPEKSRDFIIKNPGILINWKSRDPGIPGIPLGPAYEGNFNAAELHFECSFQGYPACLSFCISGGQVAGGQVAGGTNKIGKLCWLSLQWCWTSGHGGWGINKKWIKAESSEDGI